jgi:hypothetical protein
MMKALGLLGVIVYFGMGLLQMAAILGGIEEWWGWPWWIAIFVALPISYIPILGTIVGIMGAIKSFEWEPLTAILLFCWPYVLYVILAAGGGLANVFSRNRNA